MVHACFGHGDEVCRLCSIVFHPRLVGGSLGSIFWQKYLAPLLQDSSLPFICFDARKSWVEEAADCLLKAWNACEEKKPGYEFEVRENLSRLILLLGCHHELTEKAPLEKQLRSSQRVKVMLQFLQENLDHELSLEQIASSASVSKNECLRCFQSVLGTSPIQYLKEIRIQKAAGLLTGTDRKISKIASACGFQEMSYFARTFRQHMGCTPKEYRKRQLSLP